jgi:hypothetical protein
MMPTIASTNANALPSEGQNDLEGAQRDSCQKAESRSMPRKTSHLVAFGPSTDQSLTLEVAARDYIWLYDFRRGIGCGKIAALEGVNVRQVQEGIERARKLERKYSKDALIEDLKPGGLGDIGFRLTPLFPIGAFTPQSTCPHRDPMKRGSGFCCMVCHASGMDEHPGLRRDPATDPSPEPENAEESVEGASRPGPSPSPETRKQRRRRQFAEAIAAQASL